MKRVGIAIVAFLMAYAATELIVETIRRWSIQAPSKATVRVGERVVFPELRSITGSPFPSPGGKLLFVTAFSLSCPFSTQSVPLWNRLDRLLPRDRVARVLIGCGRSAEDLAAFVRETGLRGDVFFAPCDEVEAALKIGGGISHYLLDARGICRAVWTGMPVKPEYEMRMIGEVLKEVNRYSP